MLRLRSDCISRNRAILSTGTDAGISDLKVQEYVVLRRLVLVAVAVWISGFAWQSARAQDAGWSEFIVLENEDAFTDQRSVSLAAFDPGPITNKSVMLSCMPEVRAILLSDGRTRFSRTVDIRYRLDDRETQEFSAVLSPDGEGAILLNVSNQRFEEMVTDISAAQLLRFQIERGSVQEVAIRLASDDVARFRTACDEVDVPG